ncbi:hypothetical protein PENSPDRAFT_693062 [Peniophora sp. CONT]|nr:hypothetical protein PENSPDRAFT_693062 [Peniophora sp. CONT]
MSLTSGTLTCVSDDIIRELFTILADIDVPHRDGENDLDDYQYHRASIGWIRLTHVCRRLRILGLGLPDLWARIICTFPGACTTILERAQEAPLTLVLPPYSRYYFEVLPGVHDLLVRARHIVDDPDNRRDADARTWWARSPLLNLEQLEIRKGYPALTGDFGRVVAPALRKYVLVNTFIPFTAPMLQFLGIHQEMSWMDLLDAVRSCPLLTVLRIRSAEPVNNAATHGAMARAVSLPCLKELSIQSALYPGTLDFLDHLTFPNSIDFSVDYFPDGLTACHSLVSRDQLHHAQRDMLSITTSSPEHAEPVEFIIAVSEGHRFTYPKYQFAQAQGGLKLTMLLEDDEDETQLANVLAHFSRQSAQAIHTLMLRSGFSYVLGGFNKTLHDPLAVPKEEFIHLWRAMSSFENVETIYFLDPGEPSMFLLMPHPEYRPSTNVDVMPSGSEATPSQCDMAFPALHTIVIDTKHRRLSIDDWNDLLKVLDVRQAAGRPINRVVFMGDGLCHLVMGVGVEERTIVGRREQRRVIMPLQELPLASLESLVEVVDLRAEGCKCSQRDWYGEVPLPAQPGEFENAMSDDDAAAQGYDVPRRVQLPLAVSASMASNPEEEYCTNSTHCSGRPSVTRDYVPCSSENLFGCPGDG